MWLERYLIVSSSGHVRVTKKAPSLEDNEIMMRFELSLPDSLFTRPTITAKLAIDQKDVPAAEITTEVLMQTKELLERALGMRIELSPVAPEKTAEPSDVDDVDHREAT